MDKQLLSMLVCPLCKGKLKYDREAQELICTFDGLAYQIVDGVPNMLESDARLMTEEEKLEKAAGSTKQASAES
ncbi:MAG: tetraacyldisaccharide 4'-kinase [Oceanospirillaceae bacterium]|nr:tetraacyldisaccharide 4'-kinase [Oceanospirillaceae bacterium]